VLATQLEDRARQGRRLALSARTRKTAISSRARLVNSFGDNGWSFTKAARRCLLSITRAARAPPELLAKGPVKVRANVDSRYYAGVYSYVTGVIREPTDRIGGICRSATCSSRARTITRPASPPSSAPPRR